MESIHSRQNACIKSGVNRLKNRLFKKVDSGGEDFTISLHPLFFLFGVYYALIGRIVEFLVYTLSAILHEFGHAFVAHANGYSIKNLSLMPYGATVVGEFDGLRFKDEFLLILAGPITSLGVAFFTTALWWFLPESYPYTEVIYTANLTLGLINLLPAKPLDGGRLLSACFKQCFGKKGDTIFTAVGTFVASFLTLAFIVLCVKAKTVKEVNFSLIFFALFIFVGAFSGKSKNPYCRTLSCVSEKAFIRGMVVNRQIVSPYTTISSLPSL